MVELRKRPAPPPAPPPAKKRASSNSKSKKEDAVPSIFEHKEKHTTPKVGDTIILDGFGSEIQTQDEKKVTLATLVADSKAGVVLFTYPKASTPGCTNQVCLFRDSYKPLTSTGLDIYGLSNDSPKANTTFKTKQNLPYPLLCDPDLTLIEAIGMKKAAKGTTRGVFVVDKNGKVLAAEAGSPAGTVDIVKAIVKKMGGEVDGLKKTEDKVIAETAAEVADIAATMDKSKTSTPIPA